MCTPPPQQAGDTVACNTLRALPAPERESIFKEDLVEMAEASLVETPGQIGDDIARFVPQPPVIAVPNTAIPEYAALTDTRPIGASEGLIVLPAGTQISGLQHVNFTPTSDLPPLAWRCFGHESSGDNDSSTQVSV